MPNTSFHTLAAGIDATKTHPPEGGNDGTASTRGANRCAGVFARAPQIPREWDRSVGTDRPRPEWSSGVKCWNPSNALVGGLLACSGLLTVLTGPAFAAAQPSGLVRSSFIFDRGPTPANHASTIVETEKGLLAAWFGGPKARHPSNSIFTARYDGTNWSAPVQVADGVQGDGLTRYQCWNPVLFKPSRGPLLLFYKMGPDPESWWGMRMISMDQGRTWSSSGRLPDGVIGPVRNKPIELADGSLLCGASTENDGWAVHMERAFDFGKRWQRLPPLPGRNGLQAIQPTILQHGPRLLQILCRTRQGFIAESWSQDLGESWSELRLTSLANPNSAIDSVHLRNGRFLLVYNDSPSDRGTLSVAVSKDGKQWRRIVGLESTVGEFSYPAVIQARDGLVHVTYSWNRRLIRHVVIDLARLQGQGASGSFSSGQ